MRAVTVTVTVTVTLIVTVVVLAHRLWLPLVIHSSLLLTISMTASTPLLLRCNSLPVAP